MVGHPFFGFTAGEVEVIEALQNGHQTPLSISKHTALSRQGVYVALGHLVERGVVEIDVSQNKKLWRLVSSEDFDRATAEAKGTLYGEVAPSLSSVREYHGKVAVTNLLLKILTETKREDFVGIQGDGVYADWVRVLGSANINYINQCIKKNQLVVRAIMPEGNFERAFTIMGNEWAKHFKGRSYQANLIDEKYFVHKAEIFLIKKRLYFICMRDELVLEMSYPEFIKMFLLILSFIQDNSRLVDGNEILKNLVAGLEQKRTKISF